MRIAAIRAADLRNLSCRVPPPSNAKRSNVIDAWDSYSAAGFAMLACQARELAFELLELAEQADRQRRPASS